VDPAKPAGSDYADDGGDVAGVDPVDDAGGDAGGHAGGDAGGHAGGETGGSEGILQMKGLWESNINVWFPFMYSQKLNCAASLFPKQNSNVLSPNSYTHISVGDLYISRIGLSILMQPNMWTDPGNI
jgi:hypothetical protein